MCEAENVVQTKHDGTTRLIFNLISLFTSTVFGCFILGLSRPVHFVMPFVRFVTSLSAYQLLSVSIITGMI